MINGNNDIIDKNITLNYKKLVNNNKILFKIRQLKRNRDTGIYTIKFRSSYMYETELLLIYSCFTNISRQKDNMVTLVSRSQSHLYIV